MLCACAVGVLPWFDADAPAWALFLPVAAGPVGVAFGLELGGLGTFEPQGP